MKTTIDIANNIMNRSKRLAREEHLTLRSLVEEGLEIVLEKHGKAKRVKVKPVTFGGKGLKPEFRDGRWEKVRDAAYKGRGA